MNKQETLNRASLGAVVWAIAGTLFGGLYTGATDTFQVLFGNSALAWIPATALAGAITSSFFGSLRAATLGTMVGILSGVGYLILDSEAANPLPFLIASFFVAMLLSHLMPTAGFPTRPLGQAVSGLFAGLVSGILLTAGTASFGELDAQWMATIGVGLVGILYVALSRMILGRCSDRMSKVGGPLVSGLIASTVSGVIWLLINTAPAIDGSVNAPAFADVFAQVPPGALGGAIGGAIGGALFGLLGINVGNYTV